MTPQQIADAIRDAVLAEREACAREIEANLDNPVRALCPRCFTYMRLPPGARYVERHARDIRARSDAERPNTSQDTTPEQTVPGLGVAEGKGKP